MAYRDTVDEAWKVRKTSAEIAQFIKNYYKPFPINYYDRIFNQTTKANFLPVGMTASNNPEDDITYLNWTDAPPPTSKIPQGYELYMSTSLFSFDSTQQLSGWTILLASGRSPVMDYITTDHTHFRTTATGTAVGEVPIVTRNYDEINLTAHLLQEAMPYLDLLTLVILLDLSLS
jgi:hypothetical protein